jgi:hypothetical protein
MSKLNCKRTFYLSYGGKGKEQCEVYNAIYYTGYNVIYFPPNALILGYSLVLSPIIDSKKEYFILK